MIATQNLSELFVTASQGMRVELGDHRSRIIVSPETQESRLLLIECDVDFNGGVPPHIHGREDEFFLILEGRFTFGLDGRMVEAGPGDTVIGPRGIAHTWRCTSPEGGRLFILFTPGDNFAVFGREMAARGIAPLQTMADPEEAARFVQLASEYGITMLPLGGK